MTDEYRHRLSVDITREQYDELTRLIPWGLKKLLFHALIDSLIVALNEFGPAIITMAIERKLGWTDLVRRQSDDPAK